MDKRHFTPYTFRGRLIWTLYICAILSCVISLLFAYVISHVSVQQELTLKEQAAAVFMLEMQESTNLSIEDIIHMAEQEALNITAITDPAMLPEQVSTNIAQRSVVSLSGSLTVSPVTYVRLNNSQVFVIAAGEGQNLFFIALFRILFSALSYMAVVVLLATFASFHLSKPIRMMTEATAQIQQGNYNVRLPAARPDEMGQLMRSFNDMAKALDSTAYLQKDFISSISHEFKTPIASIRGFAKLLQMPGLTDEQRMEYITLIAQESDRLSRLSETLLRLSALEQQTAPASLSTFMLDEQLRQVILRLEPAWSARNIDWQLELDSVSIVSDEALLIQVWTNIVQNAIKFSPQGSMIEIRLQGGSEALVEITDHGCGMSEEAVSRIFDRFYQADTSRRQEGVGLGLCLVKRILDMLGGQISVRSAPGEGSTFTVRLPMRPAPRLALPEESSHA